MLNIILGLTGATLGVIDAVQSVRLQRTGQFIENGLPSLFWGMRPRPVQLIGGAIGISIVMLAGLLFLEPVPLTLLYGVWVGVEGWMVWRNVCLSR